MNKSNNETIDEKISRLGTNFRGLWRGYRLQSGDILLDKWSVTFIYKNNIVETPELDTPHQVLDYALMQKFDSFDEE